MFWPVLLKKKKKPNTQRIFKNKCIGALSKV